MPARRSRGRSSGLPDGPRGHDHSSFRPIHGVGGKLGALLAKIHGLQGNALSTILSQVSWLVADVPVCPGLLSCHVRLREKVRNRDVGFSQLSPMLRPEEEDYVTAACLQCQSRAFASLAHCSTQRV
jgi:hypothetical protein